MSASDPTVVAMMRNASSCSMVRASRSATSHVCSSGISNAPVARNGGELMLHSRPDIWIFCPGHDANFTLFESPCATKRNKNSSILPAVIRLRAT